VNAEFNAGGDDPCGDLRSHEEAGSPAVTLPPSLLKRRLRLPVALADATPSGLEVSLLTAFGLDEQCSDFVAQQVLERSSGTERRLKLGAFIARPKHGGIVVSRPDCMLSAALEYYLDWRDLPNWRHWGVISCDCIVRVDASLSEARKDFDKTFVALKRASNLPVSSKAYRNPKFFTRDLIVYAFRDDRTWTAHDLDVLLKHLRLPALGTVTRKCGRRKGKGYTDPKDARRKIVFTIGKLLAACQAMPHALRGMRNFRLQDPSKLNRVKDPPFRNAITESSAAARQRAVPRTLKPPPSRGAR